MEEGQEQEQLVAGSTSEAEPEVSPIPPCFFWSLFIPTIAVLAMGLQGFSAYRRQPPFEMQPPLEVEPPPEGD